MNLFLSTCVFVMCVASCSAMSNTKTKLASEVGSETARDHMLCFDEVDNDGDGSVDCEDSDCCWACLPESGSTPECDGEDWVLNHYLEEAEALER